MLRRRLNSGPRLSGHIELHSRACWDRHRPRPELVPLRGTRKGGNAPQSHLSLCFNSSTKVVSCSVTSYTEEVNNRQCRGQRTRAPLEPNDRSMVLRMEAKNFFRTDSRTKIPRLVSEPRLVQIHYNRFVCKSEQGHNFVPFTRHQGRDKESASKTGLQYGVRTFTLPDSSRHTHMHSRHKTASRTRRPSCLVCGPACFCWHVNLASYILNCPFARLRD